MRRRCLFGALLVLCAALLSGRLFLPRTISVDEDDAGALLALAKRDALLLLLPGNPSTAFSWTRSRFVDEAILDPVGEPEFVPDDPKTCAEGGAFRFTFRAVALDTTTLRLDYRRPWEEMAARTYAVTVFVR